MNDRTALKSVGSCRTEQVQKTAKRGFVTCKNGEFSNLIYGECPRQALSVKKHHPTMMMHSEQTVLLRVNYKRNEAKR